MNFGGLSATYPGMIEARTAEDAHVMNALRALAARQSFDQQNQMFPLQMQQARQGLALGGQRLQAGAQDLAGDVALGNALRGVLSSEMPGATPMPSPPGTPSVPGGPVNPPIPPSGAPAVPPVAAPSAGPGPAQPPGPAAPTPQAPAGPQVGLDWRAIASAVVRENPKASPIAIARAVDKLQKYMTTQAAQEWRVLREQGITERAAKKEEGIQTRADTRHEEHVQGLEIRRQQAEMQARRLAMQGQHQQALRLIQIERAREQAAIGSAAAGMGKDERKGLIERSNAYFDTLEQELRGGQPAAPAAASTPTAPGAGVPTYNPATGKFY